MLISALFYFFTNVFTFSSNFLENFPHCTHRIIVPAAFIFPVSNQMFHSFVRKCQILQSPIIVDSPAEPFPIYLDQLFTSDIDSPHIFTQHRSFKHSLCTTIIYFLDELIMHLDSQNNKPTSMFTIENYLQTSLIYPAIYVRSENPTAIIYLTSFTLNFYTLVQKADVTSTFYVANPNKINSLFMICNPCWKNFHPSNSNWNSMYKNFGRRILVRKYTSNRWKPYHKICGISSRTKILVTGILDAQDCFFNVLNEKLNITDGTAFKSDSNTATYLLMSYRQNLETFFQRFDTQRFVVLPWAQAEEPYSFGTLVNYRRKNVDSLTRPLDGPTWILFWAVLLALGILGKIENPKGKLKGMRAIEWISILLEQSQR